MIVALCIIAICEVIRALQNLFQIRMLKKDNSARDNAYAEFVKSLKVDDKQFVKNLLREFEREKSGGCIRIAPNDEPENHHRADGIKLWTPEECDYLLAMYVQEEDMEVVAKNLGRSVNAVKKKLKKLLRNS